MRNITWVWNGQNVELAISPKTDLNGQNGHVKLTKIIDDLLISIQHYD